jgi:uncharacterized protein (DUF39 family)
MPIIKQTQSNFIMGYQVNETGMLNQTTVSLPIPVLKDVLLNHAVFTEAEYNKGNSYLRLGALELFWKIR